MRTLRIVKDLEIIAGSIAAVQSLYLGLRTGLLRKAKGPNLFLGLLFLAMSIRIIKSLLWVSIPGLPDWIINLGFAAQLATGPLFLLYLLQFALLKKWSPHWLWHFVPILFVLLNLNSLSLHGFWYSGGYTALLFHQMGYIMLCLVLLLHIALPNKKRETRLQKKDWLWLGLLFLGMALVQLAYFSNYIIGGTPYLLGPAFYAVFIYAISFFLSGNPGVLRADSKGLPYKNISLSRDLRLGYRQRLEQFMQEKEPFLEHHCAIGDIAGRIGIPAYLLSYLINSEYGQNFPEFINSFRIQKAREILATAESRKLKIASIAYDCGFNSLSSFNSFFRKNTGLTPSAYRREMSDL